ARMSPYSAIPWPSSRSGSQAAACAMRRAVKSLNMIISLLVTLSPIRTGQRPVRRRLRKLGARRSPQWGRGGHQGIGAAIDGRVNVWPVGRTKPGDFKIGRVGRFHALHGRDGPDSIVPDDGASKPFSENLVRGILVAIDLHVVGGLVLGDRSEHGGREMEVR